MPIAISHGGIDGVETHSTGKWPVGIMVKETTNVALVTVLEWGCYSM